MSHAPRLSLCMIVKNEEKNLPRVLSSVRRLVDETVVVDTGSEDRTVEVARQYGAKVHHFSWCNDFSAARNESLKYATGDYILWLDADDEIPPEDVPVIRKHLNQHRKSVVFLTLRNIQEEGIFESVQLRIFPNHRGITFEGKIHEQVYNSVMKTGLPSTYCNGRIIHLGYENQQNLVEKMKRNHMMLEEAVREDPSDANALFFLARTIRGMNKKKEALDNLERVIELGRHDQGVAQTGIYKLAFLEKAGILCDCGRTEEAIVVLKECLNTFPGENLIRFSLGEIYFQLNDHANSYMMFLPLKHVPFSNELLPMDVTAVKASVQRYLGISSLYQGDFRTAAESLETMINGTSTDVRLYHYLALAKEKLDDIDGAIAVCRKGLERYQQESSLIKRLFLLLIESEAFDEAITVWKRLNGQAGDTDVLAAMFFLSTKKMETEDIRHYYSLLQNALQLNSQPFPEGIASVKESLEDLREVKGLFLFNSAISFLLQQNA